jgi:SAM-dependent methyltransferase
MNSNSKSKPETGDINSGWLELYAAATDGVPTWSESPPPFLDKLKPFILPKTKLLETCAGDGRITEALVEWGMDVTALDLSPAALQQLRNNFDRRGLAQPLTVRGSATDIPLGDEQFDAMICVNGFCQLDRPRLAMEEAARVLRPGGRFCLDVFTPKDGKFGVGEQIAAQDFLYKGTLFRYFNADQFVGIYKGLFRLVEMFEEGWRDPAHGDFRPVEHDHNALVLVLEKLSRAKR